MTTDPGRALEQALLHASTPDHVYGVILHDVAEVLGAVAVSVTLLDPTGEWIEVVASRGYGTDVLAYLARFRADADLPLAEAIRTKRVILVASREDAISRYSAIRAVHLPDERQGFASVPLRVGEHVVGAIGLSFDAPIDPRGPLPNLCDELGALAGEAMSRTMAGASGIRVRPLVEAARSRLAFLSAATRELARSLDRDEVLDTLTQLVVPRFADWASVLLPEGDELVAATLVHRDHPHDDPRQRAGLFRCAVSAPTVSTRVFRTGEAVTVQGIDDDVRSRMAAYPELQDSLAATTARMVVPITHQGRILGILTLGESGHARFDPDDLTVAMELASRAGTALDNASRYAAERNMVEVLQRAVLPASLPSAEHFSVTARYLPSSVTAKVGGDWYDAFALRDGRIGLCVGDVVGHGIEAASCMGQLRNALRAYALDGTSPPEVVGALNAFTIDTHTTDFATLLYATYDPASGDLHWTSAGHPPMFCRRDDEVEVLPAGHGLPIGIVHDHKYGSSTTRLAPGDVIMVFTDGLVESREEPLDVGLARLGARLESTRGRDVEGVADDLVDSVSATERGDDVCVLALQHHG